MRVFWTTFAATVLAISLAIHVSTFLGVDPIQVLPHVMWSTSWFSRPSLPQYGISENQSSCARRAG